MDNEPSKSKTTLVSSLSDSIQGSPLFDTIRTSALPVTALIRERTGHKTSELVRNPGQFGLGQVPSALAPSSTTDLICGYCSTGCSLKVHLNDEGQAVNLTPTPDYPVNLGMACPKGWEALTPLSSSDRATTPQIRDKTTGELVPTSWEEALAAFRDRTQSIRAEHGSDALAFLSTGQMCTEEMAFLGMLAKCGLGFAHGDGNTRQCMATSVVAYKQSFGFDAPPYTYADFEESDCIVLIGSNLCIAHPIMWQRILRNPHKPYIIVVDPRRTETAAAATNHVPIAPKSDLDLLYGLARLLLENGAVDKKFVKAHTEGFEAFSDFVQDFTLEKTSSATGISEQDLIDLADTIASRKRVSFWWTMGVNQGHQATRTAQAIINLALMTGNIGRPGTGANSITGQCNAMGSRLFSNTTGLLGGRDFSNPDHRAEVASITGVPKQSIPTENCLAYDEIINGIEEGRIKALWIIATNTSHSWSGGKRLQRALDKLEFLVVQDMYGTTLTASEADLVLPAAGWGEKDGTFINSERRIGLAKKVSRAPGEALADFQIFRAIAETCGLGKEFQRWHSPEAAFQLLSKLSENRPCDFSGIEGYEHLEQARGIQWPYPAQEHSGTNTELDCSERRLFADGIFYTPTGRAIFHFEKPLPPPEVPDGNYPFVLLTGRGSSAQWHTGTRTGKSEVLKKLHPNNIYCEIHPDDAQRLNIKAGRILRLSSRRGSIRAQAKLTSTVKRGEVFVPMHFAEVNSLTLPVVDPISRQPSYKHCAVRAQAEKSS